MQAVSLAANEGIEFVSDEEQSDIEATLGALRDEDKQAAKRFHGIILNDKSLSK
jgi:hypothetical protein